MKRASEVLLLLVLVLGLLVPAIASAQSVEDRESARRLFDEGKARRDGGDAAGALESFRAADALMNVPTTKLAVARAYAAVGKLVDARNAALAVAQIPVASGGEPQPFTDARASAAQLANELAGRIPSLSLTIEGDPPEELTIDGVQLPPAAWGAPRRLNPGPHVVIAKMGDRKVRAEVSLAESENKSVALKTGHTSGGSRVAGARDARQGDGGPASSTARPLGALFWTGAAVAVVGVGTGVVAGLVSASNKSDAEQFCRNDKCPPPAYDAIDAATTWATVSTVAFVAAGVGAATAGVALVLRKPDAHEERGTSASATLFVRAGGAGVAGTF